jgi:hypothetical protein
MAILLTWSWNARRSLPFNEEGRFFDPVDAVVHHQDNVTVVGIAALAASILSASLLWFGIRGLRGN